MCQDAGKKLEIRGVGRKTFREGPTGESKIEQAKTLALSSGKERDWSTLAARIARDSPEKYGASHPLGPISRQSLKIVIQNVARDCREINLGKTSSLT